VPKVHDIRWEDDQVVAIVMDYVPGKRLDEAWDTLYSGQKLAIADQIHSSSRLKGRLYRGRQSIGARLSLNGLL
jgi:hypothetical protein